MIHIMTWLRVCSVRRSRFFSSPSVSGGVDVFPPALASRPTPSGRSGAHRRGALELPLPLLLQCQYHVGDRTESANGVNTDCAGTRTEYDRVRTCTAYTQNLRVTCRTTVEIYSCVVSVCFFKFFFIFWFSSPFSITFRATVPHRGDRIPGIWWSVASVIV